MECCSINTRLFRLNQETDDCSFIIMWMMQGLRLILFNAEYLGISLAADTHQKIRRTQSLGTPPIL